MKVIHQWCLRAKCSCGYLWTNNVSEDIVCKCGNSSIENNILINCTAVDNEDEFREAVASDLGISVNELTLLGP